MICEPAREGVGNENNGTMARSLVEPQKEGTGG